MADISQTTYSNAFSEVKIYELTLIFQLIPKRQINNMPVLVQIRA